MLLKELNTVPTLLVLWNSAGLSPLLSFLLIFCQPCPAAADGLIYQLPPDGTTAEFQGHTEAQMRIVVRKDLADKLSPEAKGRLSRKLKVQATVTVSSVGQLTRAEQNCRWIELRMRTEVADARDKAGRAKDSDHILKMLIPEEFLKRGKDPLDQTIVTLFNPKAIDRSGILIEKGFNRIQYEIDRFRTVFPPPLSKAKQLSRKTIKTPARTFEDCEVIVGVTEFDRPLLDQGRWAFKGNWQVALHRDAPFGVVELQCQTDGKEISSTHTVHMSGKSTLTLTRIGTHAKSALPDEDVKSKVREKKQKER